MFVYKITHSDILTSKQLCLFPISLVLLAVLCCSLKTKSEIVLVIEYCFIFEHVSYFILLIQIFINMHNKLCMNILSMGISLTVFSVKKCQFDIKICSE